MSYTSYLGTALDGPSSRTTSRAPSPQPRGALGAIPYPPPPPTPLPSGHSSSATYGVRHTAPSAASFGPSYYQSTSDPLRPAVPPSSVPGPGPAMAPPMTGHSLVSHFNPQTGALTAAPISGGFSAASIPFAPRGLNQPPRNSMEMVQDALDQWKGKLETEQQALAALEEEERRLDAEDALLRRTLSELHVRHRAIDQMMLSTQRGWSTLLDQERDFFAREADGNEERALAERQVQLEQRLHLGRAQFQEVERRSELVRADLARHLPTETRLKQLDAEMTELLSEMRRVEERRVAAKRKCDQFYELETARERAARKHHAAVVREGIEDGEVAETASAGTSRSGSTAPAVLRDAPATESPDSASALAMDSVVLSVCNNTKKRRLDPNDLPRGNAVTAF